jgi:hypothetical protein
MPDERPDSPFEIVLGGAGPATRQAGDILAPLAEAGADFVTYFAADVDPGDSDASGVLAPAHECAELGQANARASRFVIRPSSRGWSMGRH